MSHAMFLRLLKSLPPACALALVGALLIRPAQADRPPLSSTRPVAAGPVRGADELYWMPTLEQALEMSHATGRPIFLMGYSLVGDGSTYTKLGDEFCTGVY